MSLTSHEMARYNRHLKLPGFGIEAQQRLKQASVLLIGAGGLGCPLGMYLAASGLGRIGVVDFDVIEVSNLQRQIAHHTEDAGKPKVHSLISAMNAINPLVEYQAYERKLDADWVRELIGQYDLVIDGTDNYTTRYLVADACFFEEKPLVYGAIHQFDAQLSLFNPENGPCYRCLFPTPPDPRATPSCSEAGVLGVLPGVVGVMMACEALKFISGCGKTLEGVLALYSATDQSMRHIRLNRDPSCPLCGEVPTITCIREEIFECEVEEAVPEVSVFLARDMIAKGAHILDVRDAHEWMTNKLEGAKHIPLASLLQTSVGVPLKAPLVVYCYKGSRSKKAVALLREWGYEGAVSMVGGIDAWARTIDLKMIRY